MLALALITMRSLFKPPITELVADWIRVIVSSAAFAATLWFIFGRPRVRAARYRLCAEICRSVLATWNFPQTHRQIFRGFPAEYRDFIRMLLNFRRLEGPNLLEVTERNDHSTETWKHLASSYVDDRIRKQMSYYSREQSKARRRIKILAPLSWLFSFAGLFLATAVAVASARHYSIPIQFEGLLDFGKVAFPFAAGTCVGLLAVREATRRRSRYGEMVEILKENAERLRLARYQESAEDAIVDNERALLAENVEWANIAKYRTTG
jgi:hypothetical protein